MDDKSKKVVVTKKVIVTNQPKEEKIEKKEVTLKQIEDEGVSKSLDTHLQENINNVTKKKVNIRDIFTYLLMIIIVAGCLYLIYFFLDKNNMNPFIPKETTTTADISKILTTQTSKLEIQTNTTTAVQARATHIAGEAGAGRTNVDMNTTTIQRLQSTTKKPAINIVIAGPTKIRFDNVTEGETVTKKEILKKGEYQINNKTIFTVTEDNIDAEVTCHITDINATPTCTYDGQNR
ncbi:MAG: hypothetical protein K6C11_04750 [Bacilli bacterium]|nr:hypothetical protein [Bacilli bacterium]